MEQSKNPVIALLDEPISIVINTKGYRSDHNKNLKKLGLTGVKEIEPHQIDGYYKLIQAIETRLNGFRLVTAQKLMNVCNIYDLYIGSATAFAGEIPSENLLDMVRLDAQIDADRTLQEAIVDPSVVCSVFYGDTRYLVAANLPLFKDDMSVMDRFVIPKAPVPRMNFGLISTNIGTAAQKGAVSITDAMKTIAEAADPDPIFLAPTRFHIPEQGRVYIVGTAYGPEALHADISQEITINTSHQYLAGPKDN